MSFTFDPDHVAELETEGWRAYYDKQWLRVLYLTERTTATEFHRRLSGAADHAELVDVLADLHAATFGIPRERARESADWRTRAAITVDGITGRRSTDIGGDWRLLEDQLRRCYRSLQQEIAA